MDNDKELVWKKLKEKPLFTNADGGWPQWSDGTRIPLEDQKTIAKAHGWNVTMKYAGFKHGR